MQLYSEAKMWEQPKCPSFKGQLNSNIFIQWDNTWQKKNELLVNLIMQMNVLVL